MLQKSLLLTTNIFFNLLVIFFFCKLSICFAQDFKKIYQKFTLILSYEYEIFEIKKKQKNNKKDIDIIKDNKNNNIKDTNKTLNKNVNENKVIIVATKFT